MLLTEKEMKLIKQKSIYWKEVAQRENAGEILQSEALEIIRNLGIIKTMWIIEKYAVTKSAGK